MRILIMLGHGFQAMRSMSHSRKTSGHPLCNRRTPRLNSRSHPYTFNELVSVQDSILAHMEDFRKKGIAILTTGIDPQYNYVYVGVQSGV